MGNSEMNRRSFLRSAFASTATIVVAPAAVLDELHDALRTRRTYVDMGRTPPLIDWVEIYDGYDLGYMMPYLRAGKCFAARF